MPDIFSIFASTETGWAFAVGFAVCLFTVCCFSVLLLICWLIVSLVKFFLARRSSSLAPASQEDTE